ncbi:MAG: aldo/keto reductase [Desulfobacterales bacterium]|nr:aldo/keto reductase [Desulfobacterales bacterium]
MKLNKLGNSDIAITEIGFGTNYIGGHNLYESVDEQNGIQLLQRAVDLGVNFIDTADSYGLGRSEELICKALGNRTYDVVIATKGGITFKGSKQTGTSNDPSYLRSALEASLKRLGRDYIDLYYIHKPDGTTPAEEAYGALMKFKEQGLIRAGGVSNFEITDIKAALTAGPIDAIQSRYNIFQRAVEFEILPFCKAHGISFIPWGPLAFGLLGGKYASTFRLPENDWRHRTGLFDDDIFMNNLAVVESLKKLASKRGVPLSHLAIRWLLSRPAVKSVIAGAKRPEQVEQNARACGWELSADEISRIDALTDSTG